MFKTILKYSAIIIFSISVFSGCSTGSEDSSEFSMAGITKRTIFAGKTFVNTTDSIVDGHECTVKNTWTFKNDTAFFTMIYDFKDEDLGDQIALNQFFKYKVDENNGEISLVQTSFVQDGKRYDSVEKCVDFQLKKLDEVTIRKLISNDGTFTIESADKALNIYKNFSEKKFVASYNDIFSNPVIYEYSFVESDNKRISLKVKDAEKIGDYGSYFFYENSEDDIINCRITVKSPGTYIIESDDTENSKSYCLYANYVLSGNEIIGSNLMLIVYDHNEKKVNVSALEEPFSGTITVDDYGNVTVNYSDIPGYFSKLEGIDFKLENKSIPSSNLYYNIIKTK